MPHNRRIMTLLTDFGLCDHYVGSMKGVILSINPEVNLVDITHMIPPQDIHSAAFTLAHSYRYFPFGTIHLAVVDPGVGTDRKALAVAAGEHFFVAPDNGILTYILDCETEISIYEVTADHYFHKPVSSTFHGRDVFAPIAAWISRDVPLYQLGPEITEPVRLKVPALTKVRDALIQGSIIAVDVFGNLITNLKPEDLPVYSSHGARKCKILAAGKEITSFRKTYGEGSLGELFVVPGSTEYLEIVMRNGSAASALNVTPGTPIGVVLT